MLTQWQIELIANTYIVGRKHETAVEHLNWNLCKLMELPWYISEAILGKAANRLLPVAGMAVAASFSLSSKIRVSCKSPEMIAAAKSNSRSKRLVPILERIPPSSSSRHPRFFWPAIRARLVRWLKGSTTSKEDDATPMLLHGKCILKIWNHNEILYSLLFESVIIIGIDH